MESKAIKRKVLEVCTDILNLECNYFKVSSVKPVCLDHIKC